MGPLSEDLRKRVVSAVCEEGLSCRGSARRFGVSFSSAIRWVAALHERGSYLPPYSPDFNPIEMAISKLKSALRKLAERTVAGLLAILEGCARLFKPADCQSYFRVCGYDPAELRALTQPERIPL